MANRQAGAVVEHLCQLIDTQRLRDLTDGQLLQRFVAARDEAAFTALMQRHGRLVLGVCRHVLRHAHDAEDAFQGTFLVLARKAASIRKRQSVGSWLYGVAYRVAMRAKKNAARRLEREKQAASPAEVPAHGEAAWRELQRLLDEELSRLPDRYRAPFVLCCLEGRTKPEASRELGWKEGTVSSRLAQARKLLQARLARRGVSLSAVLCGTALAAQGTAEAAVPAALVAGAGQAAAPFAAGETPAAGLVSVQAVALAEGSLRAGRLKLAAALLLLVTLAGGAAGVALYPRRAEDPPDVRPPDQRQAAGERKAKPRPRRTRPAPRAQGKADPPRAPNANDMVFAGQVLDPAGRPLANADVTLVAASELPQAGVRDSVAQYRRKILDVGKADGQGRFRFVLPRSAATRYNGFSILTTGGGTPGWYVQGLGNREDIRLQTEAGQEIRGRLVDAQGKSVRGAQVQVCGFNKLDRQGKRSLEGRQIRFALPPGQLPSWPGPATTDAQGNFVLRGLTPDCEVDLQVQDERFAPQWLIAFTGHTGPAKPVTFVLAPRRILEGTITRRDTGQPLAGAHLLVSSRWEHGWILLSRVEGQTDQQGHFRIRPFPGKDLALFVYPPDGTPYMVLQYYMTWPPEQPRHELHLALPRGLVVHGKVTERASGQPVAGASVQYRPQGTNPWLGNLPPAQSIAFWHHNARSGPDGSFRLVVLPGPGHLTVEAPTPDYARVEVGDKVLTLGRPGGRPQFPAGLVFLDHRPATGPHAVAIRLRRGVTVQGRVEGTEGKPVASALLLCPHYITTGMEYRGDFLFTRAGRFRIPGCDPDRPTPVFVLDPRKHQGARAELPARQSGPEPVIRLAACGAVKVRFTDQHGQPLDKPPVDLLLVLRPGGAQADPVTFSMPRLFGPVPAGPKGTVILANLIPGATYQLRAFEENTWTAKKTLNLKAGQHLKLPDILIAQPEKKTPGR
jgi:RNA polymerase sigma factor (sigma-70 family)